MTVPRGCIVHGLGAASTVYHAHIAARPELAGRRSLFVDLPGHGISDRPGDFGYTLEDHARAGGGAGRGGRAPARSSIAHSMGGAVAIVLAHRRPDLVSRWSSPRPTSIRARPSPRAAAASPPTRRTTYVDGGHARVLDDGRPAVGGDHAPGRPARPAPHRDGTRPRIEPHDASHARRAGRSTGSTCRAPSAVNSPGRDALEDAGVRVVTVPGAGHNVMFDNPAAFAAEVAGAGLTPRGSRRGLRGGVRPARGSGRPRRRTRSCASPNRPAGGGGWAPRAGPPRVIRRPWRAARAARPIGWNSASVPPGRTTRANSRRFSGGFGQVGDEARARTRRRVTAAQRQPRPRR